MKKLLGLIVLLLGLSSVAKAGVPQEQPLPGQNPYSHATVYVTTFTAPSATQSNLTATLAPGSLNDGGTSFNCRNCFTRFFVQGSTNVVFNVLDGATTDYAINGVALGASGVNTLSLPEDHLGPACFTAGQTTTVNVVVTNAFTGSANPISFTAEGYKQCGRSIQGGLMQ